VQENDNQVSLMLMQEYQERMDAIYQQVRLIGELVIEYKSAQDALKELASAKQGEELLVPLGGNIFLRAAVTDTTQVLASIGGGAVIEKSINSASSFLDKRILELQAQEEQLIQTSQDIRSKVEQLNQQLSSQQGTD
jgi:prefoldin alpha subunit